MQMIPQVFLFEIVQKFQILKDLVYEQPQVHTISFNKAQTALLIAIYLSIPRSLPRTPKLTRKFINQMRQSRKRSLISISEHVCTQLDKSLLKYVDVRNLTASSQDQNSTIKEYVTSFNLHPAAFSADFSFLLRLPSSDPMLL
jgi:hypothetical protein